MRQPHWPHALAMEIAAGKKCAFVWGEHDCATFVANCVAAMTGIDYAAPFRGQYKTELGAARALKKKYGDLSGYLDTLFERVPVAFARRGDVVICNSPDGPAMGICDGKYSFFAGKLGGLAAVPTRDCIAAWKV